MFRTLISAARGAVSTIATNGQKIQNFYQPSLVQQSYQRQFSLLSSQTLCRLFNQPQELKNQVVLTNTRNVTKYSFRKGKRKSVKAVVKRFYRLNWGVWIRTLCGRHKRLWKKSPPRKRRLRQHVFCNASQSMLLDKMVCDYWRKPKYFVDDPYNPYHTREEFSITSRKPKPYFPPE
ncbi:mitochondrial ribosomal protein L35 [Rhynchophorus ferrugineus]|uniref:mitochondrial ribosomal protein L35 n=1 Tax=Rhynchophorus ferrugineus TaxID=354439 RepID=UPI003FCCB057